MSTLQNKGLIYIQIQAYAIASPFRGRKNLVYKPDESQNFCHAHGKSSSQSLSPQNLHVALCFPELGKVNYLPITLKLLQVN